MLKQVQHDGGGSRGTGFNRRVERLLLLAMLALPASSAATAQDFTIPPVTYPPIPVAGAVAQDFVPRGWRIQTRAAGDLDGDSRADLALVLHSEDPANFILETMCEERFDTNPRILAVLLAKPSGGYRLAVENHELIPRRENPCEVDSFADPGQMAIERGMLRIDLERMMSAGGWDAGTASFKWRWRDDALRLTGFDYSNVRRNTGALTLVSINYLTGRVKISRGSISTDREKVRWKTLRNKRAPAIEEVGDGLMFDPEGLVSNLP